MEKKVCASPDCDTEFLSYRATQMYCSSTCRERDKAKRKRERRMNAGLCPQCGKEMDAPKSFHSNKLHVSYCSSCQDYFRIHYEDKKVKNKIHPAKIKRLYFH